MTENEKLYNIVIRIFQNNSLIRNKTIYVNMDKIIKMPIIADTLDVQDCDFWYINKSTAFKKPLKLKLELFWNFKILRKSYMIKDRVVK